MIRPYQGENRELCAESELVTLVSHILTEWTKMQTDQNVTLADAD